MLLIKIVNQEHLHMRRAILETSRKDSSIYKSSTDILERKKKKKDYRILYTI